jgi:hypothetical protein
MAGCARAHDRRCFPQGRRPSTGGTVAGSAGGAGWHSGGERMSELAAGDAPVARSGGKL